jgi:hypothetical protein
MGLIVGAKNRRRKLWFDVYVLHAATAWAFETRVVMYCCKGEKKLCPSNERLRRGAGLGAVGA